MDGALVTEDFAAVCARVSAKLAAVEPDDPSWQCWPADAAVPSPGDVQQATALAVDVAGQLNQLRAATLREVKLLQVDDPDVALPDDAIAVMLAKM